MTIRPVDINGMIQRTDDIAHMKHNQDVKPVTDQHNIQVQVDKREDQLAHEVNSPSDSQKMNNNNDAKNQGKNSYYSNKSKKKKKPAGNGKVVNKIQAGSFDVKI